jgi:hypothetical protein
LELLVVSEITQPGLIVSSAGRTSDLLDELIALVDWPVLWQPSVRLMLQQIEVVAPLCLLFWLDETHDIDHALQLIARLRTRGSRPLRVAIAHHLGPDVEPTIRAAGVHSVLNTNGSIAALVQEALVPLLAPPRPVRAADGALPSADALIRGPKHSRASPADLHPP